MVTVPLRLADTLPNASTVPTAVSELDHLIAASGRVDASAGVARAANLSGRFTTAASDQGQG